MSAPEIETGVGSPSPHASCTHKELFGVFGDPATFHDQRSVEEFHAVVEGEVVTIGVRDPALDVAGRSSVAEADDGVCVVWGEAFAPDDADPAGSIAAWVLDRYRTDGRAVFSALNGSYLVVVEVDGTAVVATDPLRTWECFYTDAAGPRAFGTDCAALLELLDGAHPNRRSVLELFHLGTVLGDRALFEDVHRVPFDGYLRPDASGELDRFVYAPRSFDHADELARRLERALRRRRGYPGSAGVLLSAGQDSRTLLAGIPDIAECYTVGSTDSEEVAVARRLAHQYGADHTVLQPDARYLRPTDDKVRYGQGIRESLHVHHAGYEDQLEVDTIYHGLLYDTLFKGYFLERTGVGVFGLEVPSTRLREDPDPVESLLDTLGFMPDGPATLTATGAVPVDHSTDDPRAFLREGLEAELAAARERTDSVHNAMDLLVLRNQPVMNFRTHLADKYLESFVAVDRELLQWHLATPPEHRNAGTVDRAIRQLDGDLMRHRPPSRPHSVGLLNHLERFARRKLPLVDSFQPAWPDRQELYEDHDLDAEIWPDATAVRRRPPRQKLRVNDLRWWLSGGATPPPSGGDSSDS